MMHPKRKAIVQEFNKIRLARTKHARVIECGTNSTQQMMQIPDTPEIVGDVPECVHPFESRRAKLWPESCKEPCSDCSNINVILKPDGAIKIFTGNPRTDGRLLAWKFKGHPRLSTL